MPPDVGHGWLFLMRLSVGEGEKGAIDKGALGGNKAAEQQRLRDVEKETGSDRRGARQTPTKPWPLLT